jgi:hypothetical protein
MGGVRVVLRNDRFRVVGSERLGTVSDAADDRDGAMNAFARVDLAMVDDQVPASREEIRRLGRRPGAAHEASGRKRKASEPN